MGENGTIRGIPASPKGYTGQYTHLCQDPDPQSKRHIHSESEVSISWPPWARAAFLYLFQLRTMLLE